MALVERLSEWISIIMLLNRQKENKGKCDITHKLIFNQYKYLCNARLVLCWNQSNFCYWLKQLFFSWNTQHCEGYCPFSCAWRIRYLCISISYLCNINVMNAMNNGIFNAESVITYLKASCCFPLVTTWKCSNTSIPLTCQQQHHFSNCPKPFPKFSLHRESSLCLWQAEASKRSSAVWAAFAGCCQQTQRWVS